MKRNTFFGLALLGVLALARPALAQSQPDVPEVSQSEHNLGITDYVCTATNDFGTQQCSVTCRSKQLADCEDAEGSGTPTCRCQAQ